MKTLDTICSYTTETLDGRDINRLIKFIPEDRLAGMGLELKPEFVGKHEHKPLTEEMVIDQLQHDVAFGFEKALNQRGLSAGIMYEVAKMWLWVLDDELENFDEYAQYGLPLFKAVAVKYGFPNPIGDDSGTEVSKYSEFA